ncbi:DNA repair protein RAD14 [Dictyocoela muelleri]|nr:DNA repair protein RAD14 [Dictyocoela muelleri]
MNSTPNEDFQKNDIVKLNKSKFANKITAREEKIDQRQKEEIKKISLGEGFIELKNMNIKKSKEVEIALPYSEMAKCEKCNSIDLDFEMQTIKINICKKCKYDIKMITKKKCMSYYLLNESELQLFPYLRRTNPLKSSFSNMILFVEDQIIDFVIKKYGSLDELELIKKKRYDISMDRKKKRLKKRISQLRKSVREECNNKKHDHEFVWDGCKNVCRCGLSLDIEEL